jgi:Fe-S cluster assembly protein SufD
LRNENLSSLTVASAHALAGPDWLRADRSAAVERFLASSLPTDALEEWRYSRIADIDLERYLLTAGPARGAAQPVPVAAEMINALGDPAAWIETVDGQLIALHGTDRTLNVEDLSAPDAPRAPLGMISGEPDAFATLNRALAPAPIRIRVEGRSEAGPIVVVHRVEAADTVVFPRILVEVDELAVASVIEVVVGQAAALFVPVTELDVSTGARLSYIHVQLLGPSVSQIGLQASRVGRDASLVSAAVAIGGDYARLRTDSALVAPGAESKLLALYFAADHQMHDFRTVQHHRAPKTQSDLLYKGVVANSARSVYSGLIRVERGAGGANAMQTNRNLVLHGGAHADSVPNLEIEDNDVRCSHASAVGPISTDERFYLESRGVPPDVTDRLIALGFLDGVLEQLPVPALADSVRRLLAAKFDAAQTAENAVRKEQA